jgi:hypothetical protein
MPPYPQKHSENILLVFFKNQDLENKTKQKQGRWKALAVIPQKCYGKLKQRHRTLRQRRNILLCWHRLSGLVSNGWALRTKGPHLIYPCNQANYRSKKQGLTSIWLHAFYRLLHASATGLSSPRATGPSSCLDSSGFISLLCHPFFPATLSEHRAVCFFSCPPPCYIQVTYV